MGAVIRAIAFPAPPRGRTDDTLLKDAELVRLKTDQGNVDAVFIHPPRNRAAGRLILYAHGNAEDLSELKPYLLKIASQCDANVFAFDYFGYGNSDGKASEKGCYQSMKAAYEYALTRVASPKRIIVFGRSLGGGPAIDLVARHPEIGGLVLQSPLTSGIKWMFGQGCVGTILSFCLTCVDCFKNDRKILKVDQPVLIMHGTHDQFIPLHHGEKVFALCRNKAAPFWAGLRGHNNMPEDECIARIKLFIWFHVRV